MSQNNLSNHLKALLKFGDITEENTPLFQSDSMTVQRFDYTFNRERDSKGLPFGPTNNTTLKIAVRVMDENHIRMLFEIMSHMTIGDFSILFNATFDENQRMSDYEDAMVVKGVIVNINESFESKSSEGNQQMILDVEILVAQVIFVGTLSNKYLCVTEG